MSITGSEEANTAAEHHESAVGEPGVNEYDDEWAMQYVGRYADRDPIDAVVTLLAGVSPAARCALEFCAGAGRIALPLAGTGIAVTAVDNSPAMLRILAKHRHDLPVTAVLADCTEFRAGTVFPLAYIVFNSLFLLPSVQSQQEFLVNAVRHLEPGGGLVVEAFVSSEADQLGSARPVPPHVAHLAPDRMELFARRWNVAEQVLWYQRVIFDSSGRHKLRPTRFQYLDPDRMDAMTSAVGLMKEAEFSDWRGSPYQPGDRNRIIIYRWPGP